MILSNPYFANGCQILISKCQSGFGKNCEATLVPKYDS
jgi:hypothetical protein